MSASPPLDPRRLLPALLRYADAGTPPACRTHAQRYMHFCVQRLQSADPAVHQLAVRTPSNGFCHHPVHVLHRVRLAKYRS